MERDGMKEQLKKYYNQGYIIDIYNYIFISSTQISELIRLNKNFKNYLLDKDGYLIELKENSEKIIDKIINELFFNNKEYLLTQFDIDKNNKIIDISFKQL